MTKREELLGHPKGLFVLFFVEMWERFSYYGMRALLIIFLVTPAIGDNPGYGWDNDRALAFYGWYTMLVYLASIPGGVLADKFIGQKKSVMIGGVLLVIGHCVLAIDAQWAFFTGVALIILGVGGLKANISSMVGGLYQKGDEKRDTGFYIFYIGINIGALLGSILAGVVAAKWGWHYGFGLAGIGMVLGQATYMWGQKYLVGVGEFSIDESKKGEHTSFGELIKRLFNSPFQLVMTILLMVLSAYISFEYAHGIEKLAYALLGAMLSITFGLISMIYFDVDKLDQDRLLVLLLSFFMMIIFWGAFEQAGGLMSLYTETKTDRWIEWMDYEVPTALFQAINAIYIVIFGTGVAALWKLWDSKGKESSSIFKMAVGTIIMGIGFVFMTFASIEYSNEGSSAMIWLFLAYLFHTIGELCASPVVLSFITKVSPVKYVSIMMGLYWAATGLGSKLAGVVGQFSQKAGELQIFTGILVFCLAFGILIILMIKPIKRLTHGAEDFK